MQIWIVLPIKLLSQTKSRLMTVLSPQERADLTRHLTERTLSVLHRVPEIAGIVIVSRDPEIERIGTHFGVRCVAEPASSGLNTAVYTGYQFVTEQKATHAFILPSDLPLLEPQDITAVCQFTTSPSCVIASDKVEEGTNALLLPTGLPFWFQYGRSSYQKHYSEAKRHNLIPHIVKRTNLQFDLDTVQDFTTYQSLKNNKFPSSFDTMPAVPDNCLT